MSCSFYNNTFTFSPPMVSPWGRRVPEMWLMMTYTKHTTVRRVHPNLWKSLFCKLFVKFANSSQNDLSPWYRNLGNRSIFFLKKIVDCFRKVEISFGISCVPGSEFDGKRLGSRWRRRDLWLRWGEWDRNKEGMYLKTTLRSIEWHDPWRVLT